MDHATYFSNALVYSNQPRMNELTDPRGPAYADMDIERINFSANISQTRNKVFIAPNFEEVEGAYWFGNLSIRPLRVARGQERLEIGTCKMYGMCLKR